MYSCNTLVAGLILQSTPIDWWCLYWIHSFMDPSIYNGQGNIMDISLGLSRLNPPDIGSGPKKARLGPAARLGPQQPGVQLWPRRIYGGIIVGFLPKGRKSP